MFLVLKYFHTIVSREGFGRLRPKVVAGLEAVDPSWVSLESKAVLNALATTDNLCSERGLRYHGRAKVRHGDDTSKWI